MIASIALALLRHLLTLAGTSLTTSGLFEGSDADKFIGAVLVLIALAFSAFDKWKQKKENDHGR